jgi:hypothetical protein
MEKLILRATGKSTVEDYEPETVKSILTTLQHIEKLKHVDWKLCCGATVIKTSDDRFLFQWEERHPEMCPQSEFCTYGGWNKEKAAEWIELHERMPRSEYYQWLTRSEAFQILMAFWLPKEFLPDMQAEA